MRRNLLINIACKVLILFILIAESPGQELCVERPIELNVENADIILTGTVRKIERNYSEYQYAAYIEIHRIIKGHHQINELFNMNMENIEIRNSLSKRTNRQSINGQIIFIYNFGDRSICDSVVKPHDVRIFMLSIDSFQRLYLNSSLIQPTLKKLRNLNIISQNEQTYDIKLCNVNLLLLTINHSFKPIKQIKQKKIFNRRFFS